MHDKASVEEHQEVIVQNQSVNPNHIKIIEGDSRILLIAPHACIRKDEPKDDENTGLITEMVAHQIGCSAIINNFFHKPDNKKYRKGYKPKDKEYPHGLEYGNLNLNLITDAQLIPDYLNAIRAVIDTSDKTTVIWIHGADDNKAKEIALKGNYAYMPNDIHAFIGYGQGDDSNTKNVGNRYTAESDTVERFRDALIRNGIHAVLADDNSSNYRGRSEAGMNQWFLNGGYTLDKVQSFQIEIRKEGFREDDEQCRSTAKIIADAISATLGMNPVVVEEPVLEILPVEQTASDTNATEITAPTDVQVPVQDNVAEIVQDIEDPLVEQTASDTNATEGTVPRDVPVVVKNKKVKQDPVDEELVQNAFERLKDIFKRHFHNAMVEAGRDIIDTFYGGDPMAALAKNKTREQPQNLKALVRKISGAPSVNDDGAPSLGWFYNAVNLAAHEAICLREGLQAFATLGHSHKLLLLHVPKLKQIEGDKFDEAIKPAFQVKERLALVAVEKDLSVREFAAHIKTEFPDENTGIDLTLLPPREKLRLLSPDDLRRLFNLAENKVDESQKAVLTYGKALHEFGIVLAEKNEKDVLGKGHFQDWTKNNVNICTGCENDCIYCYMKSINARNPKSKQPVDWHNWEIRTKDVDKVYRLKDGLVGFPSSHDIFPEILDAYLTVLGKLLRAGNRVLIVSKPRIDCIKPICEASHFFKDKIIFRFTIGAMDDEILKLWEPNAPGYEERRACLEFAYNQGFWTSVSMEPMLDTPRIEEQIADLRQFVREDEHIWLGTMGYLKQIKEWAGDDLAAAIAKVEAGQTVEMLTAIYQTYKDDSLIEWKTDTLEKIIGKQKNDKAAKKFQAPVGNQVTDSITAPVDQIHKAIDVVSKEAGEKFASLKKPLESRVVTRRTSKGWEKIKIKTTSGEKVDAIAPLIISASRRNDTPARHSEWFIDGLKKGYLEVSQKHKYVSFEKARLIVFWTKNPEPLLNHLHEIDEKGIGYYFQYTLNDYDDEGFEPNIPPLAERIKTFKRLSDMIGREKVIWRYDPLILAGDATPEQLVGKVESIMEQLAGHTEKLVISFYRTGDYKHTLRRMQKNKIFPRDFKPEEITFVAKMLGELGQRHGMKVATCADSGDLSLFGIEHNKCIDDELIKRVFKDDKILIPFLESRKNLRDTGQREKCRCIVSEEIGSENTCANGCLYCYANKSDKALERNLGLIKESEKVNLKESPEALPSKDVSPTLNSNDRPQPDPNDEAKTKRFRGKLA